MPEVIDPTVVEPIKISSNAALFDFLKAGGRYIVVIITLGPAVWKFLKSTDFLGLYNFLQGSDGAQFIAAVVGLVTLGYGLWRTFHRATQVVSVATDDRVPTEVASLK